MGRVTGGRNEKKEEKRWEEDRREAQVAELSVRWELSAEMWSSDGPQLQKLMQN